LSGVPNDLIEDGQVVGVRVQGQMLRDGKATDDGDPRRGHGDGEGGRVAVEGQRPAPQNQDRDGADDASAAEDRGQPREIHASSKRAQTRTTAA